MFAKKGIRTEVVGVRKLARALLMAVIAHGLSFATASGQSGCPTPWPQEAVLRDHVADIFTSPGFSAARSGLGIATLDSGVTKSVVTDDAVCNAIYTGIYENIARMWKLPAGTDKTAALASQSIHYCRVGDYYVAMLITKPDSVLVVNGWASVMIFNRNTLQFIGVVRA